MTLPPFGVTPRDGGVDVAVFSSAAEAIEFCVFAADGTETSRTSLPHRTGDVFHGFVAGVADGTKYGLRAHGPFAPSQGNRFNPNKLLLDPYAIRIDRRLALHPSMFDTGAEPSLTDSAAFMPKGLVSVQPHAAPAPPPCDVADLIIYELHVRGFSALNEAIPPAVRGTFAGLAHDSSIEHLRRLGVTAVEILPCAAWLDERHLPPLGLSNYWGYNPVAFCAPDPRLAPGGFAEIRAAITALRQAGIATILDVVFNHTGEGDHLGPTVSLRGLDNAYYYRLQPGDASRYVDDAGCGNVLAAHRPHVVRMVMDALRLWVGATGADGFRFDLATTLGRNEAGFNAAAPLLTAIAQEPLLRDRLLIAEPWDIGKGGYQLGSFEAPWMEWNDRFRDTARRFWRGDAGTLGDMATRLAGSADIFGRSHRPPASGINYVTAHDGFTLRDLLSYTQKRNNTNGEQNRDGTDDNLSWNHGVEGPTNDASIIAARARDARAMLATLLFARGTPMLTMGDETGRTQQGNNNAYAQDNAVSWLNWNDIDTELRDSVRGLIRLRRATSALRENRMLTGAADDASGLPDVAWLRPDGAPMSPQDWQAPSNATLIAVLYTAPARAIVVLHAGWETLPMRLPPPLPGHGWELACDTGAQAVAKAEGGFSIGPRSVVLIVEQQVGDGRVAAPVQPASAATLDRLASAAGLSLVWWDVQGRLHTAPPDTLLALVAALGLPAGSENQARESLASLATRRDLQPLPAALVANPGTPAALRLGPGTSGRDRWLNIEPLMQDLAPVRLKIAADDGVAEAFDAADGRRVVARRVALPVLPAGRYRLSLEGVAATTALTVAPARCHVLPGLANGGRGLGVASHLYTLRHAADQGVGDFTALAELASVAGPQGAAALGLNPLHALFRCDRGRASPYHPADRRFLDAIYVDVTRLGPLGELPPVRAALEEGAPAIAHLRAAANVDYEGVWALKDRVLRAAFAALPSVPSVAASVDAFIAAGGERLRGFAVWEALSQTHGADWHIWPAALRDPAATAVASFAAEYGDEVRYSAFLQYLAEQGLATAAGAARQAGAWLGLYRDLAVGCAPDGAEAWAEQGLYMSGASVGAPPDLLGPHGQVWHLPPPHPIAMAEDGFAGFAHLLAANMRHAGALRIDHVMGLTRLFLIPAGGEARDGTYLSYPLENLLGEVALESTRAGCMVVGEDLGTVPPEIRVTMAARSVLSYRVLWFEQDDGVLRPPAAWPALAAACVSTHDLPTLAGWWTGADLDELVWLGLLDAAASNAARAARQADKAALMKLLTAESLCGSAMPDTPPVAAIHALVARAPSLLALAQADDLAGEMQAVNLPGTDHERPNWRRRLHCDAGSFVNHPVLAAMRAERPVIPSLSNSPNG
jgi:glycogen debranching enzyme GlgX/4-alpha-glucanotransferase